MAHLELKQKLVDECRKQQQKIIDNLRSVMSEAQQSANEYGTPKDRYDSYRMQLLRKKDMYAQQLEKAMTEFLTLEKIDVKNEMNKVGFGSLVITKDQKIFISIGIGKLIVENENYLAVSLMVPLSQAIVGKQKGDVAEFNGKRIEIFDVF
jgi:transcription elongation GreA/GreB family factor